MQYLHNMDINSKVVARIKQSRVDKNILQKYVADEIGISQAAYARIENGNTQLTIKNLYSIAQILDTQVVDLLNIESEYVINNNENLVMTNINKGHLVIHLNANEASELLKRLTKNSHNH
jgi:transcriptional regulator with XRE-family HTH domain